MMAPGSARLPRRRCKTIAIEAEKGDRLRLENARSGKPAETGPSERIRTLKDRLSACESEFGVNHKTRAIHNDDAVGKNRRFVGMNANSEGNSYGYRSERQNREVLSQRRGALGSSDASGRSAADAFFYSVKDSRRGATTFLPPLVAPVLLTAAPAVPVASLGVEAYPALVQGAERRCTERREPVLKVQQKFWIIRQVARKLHGIEAGIELQDDVVCAASHIKMSFVRKRHPAAVLDVQAWDC